MPFFLSQILRTALITRSFTNRQVNEFELQFSKQGHQQLESEWQANCSLLFRGLAMQFDRDLDTTTGAREDSTRKRRFQDGEITNNPSQLEISELALERYFRCVNFKTILTTRISLRAT